MRSMATILLNGSIESWWSNTCEKRGKVHLAQNVLGLRRAGFELPAENRAAKFWERWGRKIIVSQSARGGRGGAKKDASVVGG
jgi:hypothetical protein